MGIERIAMLRWGINDIRLFTENDPRFWGSFSEEGFKKRRENIGGWLEFGEAYLHGALG